MPLHLVKISYIALNVLLLFIAGLRLFAPFYLYYRDPVLRSVNYDREIEITSCWMIVLIPWDIILALSGIKSVLRNDREQIFENTFKLSVLGLAIIWMMEGIGDRFQIRAPYILKTRMRKYSFNPKDKQAVDFIQTYFKCCGYKKSYTWNPETSDILPSSCCEYSYDNCTIAFAYSKVCKYVFTEYVHKLNVWLFLANFPIIEVLMSLFNCFLSDTIPSSNVIYELEGNEDRVIPSQRTHEEIHARLAHSALSSPPIPIAAPIDKLKDGNKQSGISLRCPETTPPDTSRDAN